MPAMQGEIQVKPLELLRRVTMQMTASGQLSEVLDAIAHGLVEETDAVQANVWLLGESESCEFCRSPGADILPGPALHVLATAGFPLPERTRSMHQRLGSHLAGRAAAKRAPMLVNDFHAVITAYRAGQTVTALGERQPDEYPDEIEWAAQQAEFRAWAGYPLLFRGDLLGALDLMFSRPIGPDEFEQLEVFAYQAATAIQSARLYTELERLKDRLQVENAYLQEEIRSELGFEEVVGESPALRTVQRGVRQVAPTDSTVLLLGETGTGKELVARAIHALSPRKGRPFVKVNCAGLTPGLVESELFGHERGAFTGAVQRRVGRFELADGGTLFLDEVGELPPQVQVKLLRVLQDQEFERVGSSRPIQVDVRVVAATNRDLEAAVAAGDFRSDLYFRLNVFPIRMPPLRERASDIPLLVQYFVAANARKLGKPLTGVCREGMRQLTAYPWPGNIRELQNVIERACILASGPVVELPEEFEVKMPRQAAREVELTSLAEMERIHISRVLEATGGRIQGPGGAAAILGLHPNTLRSRMDRLGMGRTRRG